MYAHYIYILCQKDHVVVRMGRLGGGRAGLGLYSPTILKNSLCFSPRFANWNATQLIG